MDRELREAIKPDIIKLIEKQRLKYLTEGTAFVKYSTKGQKEKHKMWFCRLSSNHKVLHYGDCDENRIPVLDELVNKLSIIDIKSIITGKDCPHMKDNKSNLKKAHFAFSIIPVSDQEEPLNFVALDEKTYDFWIDGLNVLLGQEMTSNEALKDMELLLGIEMKLRMMDTEGVELSDVPPEIPPSPPNYDFAFKY